MRLLIAGAGGHAKVVVDAAVAAGLDIAGVLGTADDPASVLGVPVVHDPEACDADCFVVAVGDNATRVDLARELLAVGLVPVVVAHPTVTVAPSARIGGGTFLAAGVIVNADAVVGEHTILNTACTVDHDCRIGDFVHIGPNVSLCGGVEIGEGSLLGVGSSAMPKTTVGEWAVVGAGATVVADLPAHMVCVGTPARPIHPVRTGA